jgi:hypothetical protein
VLIKELNVFANAKSRTRLIAGLAAVLLVVQAHAITISMEYTDEGDTPPHPENPTWDPAGVILKAHFQEAKRIWESLLPGEGEYEFDFHWDDDISGLALHTTGIDEYIEVNPNFNRYADSDFFADNDFNFSQTLYSGLPSANQAAWFSGTPPPSMLEVGFVGLGNATLSQSAQAGVTSANGFDLLTTILHEMGHALGISDTEPGDYNINPQHIGGGLNNVLVNEAEDDDILNEARTARALS